MAHLGENKRLINGNSSDEFLEESTSEEKEDGPLLNSKDLSGTKALGELKSSNFDISSSSTQPIVNGQGPLSSPNSESPDSSQDGIKKVTFSGDGELYDLNNSALSPIIVRIDEPSEPAPISEADSPSSEEFIDAPAILLLDDIKDDDTNSNPSNQDGLDQSGHRHFDVINVDESALKMEIEAKEKSEQPKPENQRPTLLKVASSTSDGFSGQSNISANQDTIGPLDNPDFLKRLQYSVSQAVEDDAFGNANIDLEEFAVSSPPSPPDMDRGWAWVILFSAFFSLTLTGATIFTAGVLMPTILKDINNDKTVVSWIGAVHVSVLCMSGPFVSIVLSRLGSRWTVFCAGIFLSAGMIGASFCTTVPYLILTHGLISGMGSGFILNTMFVTVGQFFNRYRGLACGLLATGSGVGMLAGGNALNFIHEAYGLSGTYLLWGGVTSHVLIFALLLRPSPEEQLRKAEKRMKKEPEKLVPTSQQDWNSGRNSVVSGLNSNYSGGEHQGLTHRFQRYPSKLSRGEINVAPLLKTVLHKEMSRSSYSVGTNRSYKLKQKSAVSSSPSTTSKFTFGPASTGQDGLSVSVSPSPGTTPMSHSPLVASPLAALEQGDRVSPTKKPNQDNMFLSDSALVQDSDGSQPIPSSPSGSQAFTEYNQPFRRRFLSQSSQAQSQYSSGRLSHRPSIREQLQRNDLDNESLASTLVSHLQPRDALMPRHRLGSRSISSLMGSISSFPTALAIVKDDLSRLEAIDGPEPKTAKDYLLGFLDSLRLLRNWPFLVFISTSFLWAFGESPFNIFLPQYSMEKGTSLKDAATLFTGMGFGSMCGRFLSGLVASDSGVGPILLHIGCLFIGGLVIAVCPFITETYIQQMVCATLFGLYTGSLVPLSSLITIELLGIGELGLGFGFLSMAQGIGYLLGPPVAGVLSNNFGYKNSFIISGCIVMSGSFVAMLIPILLHDSPEIDDDHDSLDDLERALQRISASDDANGSDEEVSAQEDIQSQRLLPLSQGNLSATGVKKKDDGLTLIAMTEISSSSVVAPIKEEAHEVIPEEKPTELATIVEEAEKKSLASLGDLD
ncbi:hypothetical protein BgiMline_000816 [Biomphalaria glabrata]|uniref:Uncharacterized protein LOC106059482 n=1 Tax=Biomphalaria glabrata TaxID=6526 RepID=A0A9W2YZL2_BIOGL|nr:uncharacterized protein LOC106059482 [Biomphalaria glabrata]XP_055868137.1 uncharacterized protein LOC106059482 [Biomphalaria glabrata]KAI8768735.1 monocarboxylate transporter 2-like isoform X1 [Biomphalaria glabrata]KAI8788964.1 monocarboxylate transporter 2 isoform X1 [Biomphalaria glabrata]